MRITEEERTAFSKFRDVSDLRTQFQCEYRLYLKQRIGDSSTDASIQGIDLHRKFSEIEGYQQPRSRIIPVLIILGTIILGLLWILG